MFLTQAPVGGAPPAMPRALRAFPIAGGLIGLAGGVFLVILTAVGVPAIICGFLTLAALALLTGALHEDGLADTADGLGGGASRDDKLRIMADSRLGSYGAVALILTLAIKATALAQISMMSGQLGIIFALVAAGSASRLAPVAVLWALPPARPDGLGHTAGRPDIFTVAGAAVAALVMILPAFLTYGADRVVTGALIAAFVVAVLCRIASVQIGGQTGDIAGASVILSETAILAGLSIQ